jgi:hypothetical protein
MKKYALSMVVALALLGGCAADVSASGECEPLHDRCEGDEILTCQLDVDALMRGHHVYVWAHLIGCNEDDPLGTYTCVATPRTGGRVEASCELVDEEATSSSP